VALAGVSPPEPTRLMAGVSRVRVDVVTCPRSGIGASARRNRLVCSTTLSLRSTTWPTPAGTPDFISCVLLPGAGTAAVAGAATGSCSHVSR
jgi:hypothetical protein